MAAPEPVEIPVKLVFGVPEVAEVRRLVLRPGDRLVVKLGHLVNDAEWDELVTRLRAVLDGIPALILEPGIDLEVLSAEAAKPPEPGGM